jgi:hypothetical protein
MHHLRQRFYRSFAGHVDDRPGAALEHCRQKNPAHPNGGEHIDVEIVHPVFVRQVFERFDREDADVIDQDVHVTLGLRKLCQGGSIREDGQISGHAFDIAQCGKVVHAGGDFGLGQAVHDEPRAFLQIGLRRCFSDA